MGAIQQGPLSRRSATGMASLRASESPPLPVLMSFRTFAPELVVVVLPAVGAHNETATPII